ncbi:hypothetical protein ACOME3_001800 [Neoechinorhynchus agilis]
MSYSELGDHLMRAAEFLSPYYEFLNTHNVDFLLNDNWNRFLPQPIFDDLIKVVNKRIGSNQNDGPARLLIRGLTESHVDVLNTYIVNPDQVLSALDYSGPSNHGNLSGLCGFMGEKKSHEVQNLAPIIKSIYDCVKCDLVIDVGSGKGYLDTFLTYFYNIPVVGIESSEAITTSAKNRKKRMMFRLRALRNCEPKLGQSCRLEELTDVIVDEKCLNTQPIFAQVQRGLLCGLHSCGQLSATLLKSFILNDRLSACVVIPCCYQRFEESNYKSVFLSEEEYQKTPKSFPLSSALREVEFKLGRDARSLSCRGHELRSSTEHALKQARRMWFRIVLEFVLTKLIGFQLVREHTHFGRSLMNTETMSQFSTYCYCVFDKLKLPNALRISRESLDSIYKHSEEYEEVAFFAYLELKLSFCRLLELMVLLDWLEFLKEQHEEGLYCFCLFVSIILSCGASSNYSHRIEMGTANDLIIRGNASYHDFVHLLLENSKRTGHIKTVFVAFYDGNGPVDELNDQYEDLKNVFSQMESAQHVQLIRTDVDSLMKGGDLEDGIITSPQRGSVMITGTTMEVLPNEEKGYLEFVKVFKGRYFPMFANNDIVETIKEFSKT